MMMVVVHGVFVLHPASVKSLTLFLALFLRDLFISYYFFSRALAVMIGLMSDMVAQTLSDISSYLAALSPQHRP